MSKPLHDQPKVHTPAVMDQEEQSWRDAPVRHDPKTGATLYYLGFTWMGFTVRRLQKDGSWGLPFGHNPKTSMARTVPGKLPVEVDPPC